jgi:hypothetical protein
MVEMLTFRLLQREARQEGCAWDTGLKRLRQNTSASGKLQGLCGMLFERVKLDTNEEPAIDG